MKMQMKVKQFKQAYINCWFNIIGADSMGAIAPTGKKLWGGGDLGASPPDKFCYLKCFETVTWVDFCTGVLSTLYTVKMDSKNYERFIMQVTKVRWFQFENAPKAFGDRAPPRPAGGAYSAPRSPRLI